LGWQLGHGIDLAVQCTLVPAGNSGSWRKSGISLLHRDSHFDFVHTIVTSPKMPEQVALITGASGLPRLNLRAELLIARLQAALDALHAFDWPPKATTLPFIILAAVTGLKRSSKKSKAKA
jgi:hypothetical protein